MIDATRVMTFPARARWASDFCSSPKPRRSPARREDEVACSASAARAICSCASAGADGKAMPLGISTKARQAGDLICSQSRSPQYCQCVFQLGFAFSLLRGRAWACRESPFRRRGTQGLLGLWPSPPPSAGRPSHALPTARLPGRRSACLGLRGSSGGGVAVHRLPAPPLLAVIRAASSEQRGARGRRHRRAGCFFAPPGCPLKTRIKQPLSKKRKKTFFRTLQAEPLHREQSRA